MPSKRATLRSNWPTTPPQSGPAARFTENDACYFPGNLASMVDDSYF